MDTAAAAGELHCEDTVISDTETNDCPIADNHAMASGVRNIVHALVSIISTSSVTVRMELLRRVAAQNEQQLESALKRHLLQYLSNRCSSQSCAREQNVQIDNGKQDCKPCEEGPLMPHVTELRLPKRNDWQPLDAFASEMFDP